MMPDIHPSSIALEPEMKLTLAAWFAPVTLAMAGLLIARFRLNRRLRALEGRRVMLESPGVPAVHLGETVS
jgi:hypothetical protein